jgi:hypothetical protein
MRYPLALTLLAALAAAPSARAEDEGRLNLLGHHYSVIAGASVFVPRDDDTKSIYGHKSIAPVLALWNFATPAGFGIAWDLGAQRMRDLDREAAFIHVGLGPRILFAPSRADVAPYLTVRGDAYIIRLDHGSWRTKPGANVELGAALMRHFVVSARYDEVPKTEGVSLSGFSARATVKVF